MRISAASTTATPTLEITMRKILTGALLSAIVVLLAGCPNPPVKPEPTATVEDRTAKGPDTSSDTKTGAVIKDNVDGSVLTNPNSILSKRSIYFEYDKFDIQDQYKPLVEAHARYLTGHPDRKILIQGNCDERGSREYNVALGQKRADAVKRALLLLGAKEGQIESVSLGEEKPKSLGHDEASWAENRRGDVLYNGEY
jgi:peptidoglycan-associated lipoprotein